MIRKPVAIILKQDASKGYGFITCEDLKTSSRILATRSHVIKGRVVEVNKALGKTGDVPEDVMSKGLRKLFVGGLNLKTDRGNLYVTPRGSIKLFLTVWKRFKRICYL